MLLWEVHCLGERRCEPFDVVVESLCDEVGVHEARLYDGPG